MRPAAGATWTDLVRAAFAAECELLPFRRYPFAALQREWGKQALLQVAFNYTRFHLWQAVVERGWQVDTGGGFAVELEENHFPLMVNFNYDDRLERLRLTLDTQMSAPAATVLLGYYLGILEAMSADPDGALRGDRAAAGVGAPGAAARVERGGRRAGRPAAPRPGPGDRRLGVERRRSRG